MTRTVLGESLKRDYGIALAHEHLLIDIRCWLDNEGPRHEQIPAVVDGIEAADLIREINAFGCADNLVLDDERLAIDEVDALARLCPALIVDVTPTTVARNVAALQRISRATGVDVVCGCGPYIEPSWPPGLAQRAVEEVFEELLAEVGPDGSAGVIGEIGTSFPMTAGERDVLIAAAHVQRRSGAPLYVHLDPWGSGGPDVIDVLRAEGADLSRVVLCHMDPHIPDDLDHIRVLLDSGAYCAIDIWGDESRYGSRSMPTDQQRAAATAQLIADGFGSQLVHAHDVCTKTQLRRFGGSGYVHLALEGPQLLRSAGLSNAEIDQQLVGNVLTLLGTQGVSEGSG